MAWTPSRGGLVKEGMTVFVTTAYLDEAERCDRVALMHRGQLICCDTPSALKRRLPQVCCEVRAGNLRRAREVLAGCPGVTSVEPAGAVLHLFLTPGQTSPEILKKALLEKGLGPVELEEIEPSLEDVFIALIRGV